MLSSPVKFLSKSKKKKGGVSIGVNPSQTINTKTSKETAYINKEGQVVVVGMSVANPNAGSPPPKPSPFPTPKPPVFVNKRGGGGSGSSTYIPPEDRMSQAPQSQNVEPIKINNPQKPKPNTKDRQTPEQKWAAYDPQRKAVVTSDNKVYPSLRRRGYNGWIPEGYKKGKLVDETTNLWIKEVDPVTNEVKGSFGTTIKERYLYNDNNYSPVGSDNRTESLNNNNLYINNGFTSISGTDSSVSSDSLYSGKGIKNNIWKNTKSWSDRGTKGVAEWNELYKREKGIRKAGAFFVTGVASFLNTLVFQTPNTIVHPVATFKSIGKSILSPIKTTKSIVSKAKNEPAVFTGEAAAFATPSLGGKITKLSKNKAVSIIGKEVKTNDVFGNPLSTSKAEIISKFEKTKVNSKYQTVHTTSTKFSKFDAENVKRVEDKGVFVADWGNANRAWLGLGGKTEFSFNPLKNFGKSPNIIKIEVEDIKELPKPLVSKSKSIMAKAGRTEAYNNINAWYERNAKPNTAYIPFRTEIWETKETQAVIPYKYETKLKREGNILQRLSGFKEYTKVDGINVPIRKFETARKLSKTKTKKIQVGEITKYYSSIYDYKRYKTPSYLSLIKSRKSSNKSYKRENSYKSYESNYKIYTTPSKKYLTNYSSYKYPPNNKYSYKYPPQTIKSYYSYIPSIISKFGSSKKKKRRFKIGASRKVGAELNNKKYNFKTKYTPSFTASVFKIKGKKPKEVIKGYSPFIRPII